MVVVIVVPVKNVIKFFLSSCFEFLHLPTYTLRVNEKLKLFTIDRQFEETIIKTFAYYKDVYLSYNTNKTMLHKIKKHPSTISKQHTSNQKIHTTNHSANRLMQINKVIIKQHSHIVSKLLRL